jgi:hypothetical protein
MSQLTPPSSPPAPALPIPPQPHQPSKVGGYTIAQKDDIAAVHDCAGALVATFDAIKNVLHLLSDYPPNEVQRIADDCHRLMAALITAGISTSDAPTDITVSCPATRIDEDFCIHRLQGGGALCICHQSCKCLSSCGALVLKDQLRIEYDCPCCADDDVRKTALLQCIASIASIHRFTSGGKFFSVKRRGSDDPYEQVLISFKIGHHFKVCDKGLQGNLPEQVGFVWKGSVDGKKCGVFRLKMKSMSNVSAPDTTSPLALVCNIPTSHYLIPLTQCIIDDLNRRVHNIVSGNVKWNAQEHLVTELSLNRTNDVFLSRPHFKYQVSFATKDEHYRNQEKTRSL